MSPLSHSLEAREARLARLAALAFQDECPYFFDQIRVPISDVAAALGAKVEERANLRQRAQLEIISNGIDARHLIVVRSGLDPNVRRFALAHEIGHIILSKKRREFGGNWDSQKEERFANSFASELLLSSAGRARVEAEFPSLSDPHELLRLASIIGFSLHSLLNIATEKRLLKNSRSVWLRVKYVENSVTHTEPKLRIVSAHYDRDSFFIPANQSLARFSGSDAWLSSIPIAVASKHSAPISLKIKQPLGTSPGFRSVNIPSDLCAMRLQPSVRDLASYFIVLAKLNGLPTHVLG